MKIPKNTCWSPAGDGSCAGCSRTYDSCRYHWCKAHRTPEAHARVLRDQNLKRCYGITQDDFQRMLVEQGGVCAICRKDDPGGRHGEFHVDHCHDTGTVRGLLCDACNRMLGFARDNSRTLNRAGEYLRMNR